MAKLKDKKLYSYKRALEQPIWLQKITERISLNNPIRFSMVAYFVIFFGLFYFLFHGLIAHLAGGLQIGLLSFPSYGLATLFSDFKPDGKSFPRFLWDYAVFYFSYGWKKGYFYKNKYVGTFDEEEEDDNENETKG